MCYYTKNQKPKDGIIVASMIYSLGTFTRDELNKKVKDKGIKTEIASTSKINLVDRTLLNLINSGKVSRRGSKYKIIG